VVDHVGKVRVQGKRQKTCRLMCSSGQHSGSPRTRLQALACCNATRRRNTGCAESTRADECLSQDGTLALECSINGSNWQHPLVVEGSDAQPEPLDAESALLLDAPQNRLHMPVSVVEFARGDLPKNNISRSTLLFTATRAIIPASPLMRRMEGKAFCRLPAFAHVGWFDRIFRIGESLRL
jgi:hypothetical protein